MVKKSIAFLLALVLVFNFSPPLYAAKGKPSIYSRSAVIYDPVGKKVIYAKNIYVRRPVASITKVMTAMVVLDRLSLNKKVKVSRKASLAQPSKVYLRKGEYYTVRDLLYSLLLNSGNDAAVCLAEAVAGTEWDFVALMNKKARAIGLKNTRFINASGLPGKGQYSTAYDLARLMAYTNKYPVIRKIMRTRRHTIRERNGRKIYLKNHNRLLWNYSKKVIGKTGYTRSAGKCFLGEAYYGRRRVVVCALNSKSVWRDTRNLIDYVFGKDNRQLLYLNKISYSRAEVKAIQRALKRAGCYTGRIDGLFGRKTLQAVFKFQGRCGLKVDGLIGPKTMRQLNNFM